MNKIRFKDTTGNEVCKISEMLDWARQHNLEAEIVYSLVKYIRENPNISLTNALNAALDDWDI